MAVYGENNINRDPSCCFSNQDVCQRKEDCEPSSVEEALTFISYIGMTLSVIGLTLTIITLMAFK